MQKNKINLIILIPKFKFSGAGNSVFRLINFLEANKFDISVICLNKCDYKKKFNKKVNVYEINSDRLIKAFFKILKITKKISQKYSKNIILSNHHYANIYSILLKLILKDISVLSVERTCIYELSHHYSILDKLKKTVLKLFVKNFYRYSDFIVSNTKFTKNEIKVFSRNNIKHIYPPTLKRVFNFKKKNFSKYFNIIWVGRIDREKGIEEFIKLICKIDFKAKIFILGDGNLRKYYENFVSKNKNTNVKVYFKGYFKDAALYYKKSHLLINTSHFEGSNNSIVEALNYNLVVMASNTPGGNNELIKNTHGVLFNLEEESINLKKIKFIKNNFEILQSKIKSKKKFLRNFVEKKSHYNYLKILDVI